MLDSLLFSAARVWTFIDEQMLTSASGFFFEVGNRLFLITSRHVLSDEDSAHYPNRIEIEVHTAADNLAASIGFSIPLYRDRKSVWRDGRDSDGVVDVAAIELERDALPSGALVHAFTPAHLPGAADYIEIGSSLLVVGFPLGFHDSLHHMPVVRQAVLASAFGLRFDGHGYFLTDARTHRGTSGAPVVMRVADNAKRFGALPWLLLGVHSSRVDIGSRDLELDEALGLNCAWYSSILPTLVGPRVVAKPAKESPLPTSSPRVQGEGGGEGS